MTEIEKRQEIKDHIAPVEEKHHQERSRKRRQLDIAPEQIAILTLAQLSANRPDIVAKETQEHVAPRIFRFAVVAVFID